MGDALHDVVVVLPGIMGSALRNRDGDDVWKLSARTIVEGVLGRLRTLKALQLPEGIGDDHPGDGVVATELMRDMHVIPGIWTVTIGYDRLDEWLRANFDAVEADATHPDRVANYVRFPYDWRLSNRYNARKLQETVEPVLERFRSRSGHADAKLVFIGHSMGGLVARYYVDVLGGHELTAKVITLGTPHRGALNALVSLVNGVRKGFGPIGVDLTQLARSLPALYQLLPEYACIESERGLLKTTETALPDIDEKMVADAMRFHEELRTGAEDNGRRYDAHPILARTQPTGTTARIAQETVEALRTITDSTGHAEDQKGDGTVPRLSAAPYGVASNAPILRYVQDKHGALPKNEPALAEMAGVLTGSPTIPRGPREVEIGVTAPDVLLAGETLDVTIEADPALALHARLVGPGDRGGIAAPVMRRGDHHAASFVGLAPGAYELRVGAEAHASSTVTTPVVVFDTGP
jgi:pimeloyl-ACP methyl ester carboxylesterase